MPLSVDTEPPPPDGRPPIVRARPRATPAARATALFEVLICSGYPTQLALAATLAAAGLTPTGNTGRFSIQFVVALSLLDTVALLGLVWLFLRSHGERPVELLFGRRPAAREALAGLPLTLLAFAMAAAVLASIQQFAPWLRTVERNPLQDLLRTPRDTVLFALLVVLAGGVREEVQRAFLLHRFEQWLGGGTVGVVVASVAFGAGHLLQGADAAVATGILGALWGVVYLRRRSIVAPVVSHSGFNLLQLAQFIVVGR